MSHTKAAIAAFAALDELVNAAPDSARIKMLWLLVPIVISYLREGAELQRAPPHVRALHEFALHWLTKVGPKHPQEFKTMMQQSSELRNKLENALKANQASARSGRSAQSQRPLFDAKPAKPTIQLKTDFSDFR
ncbi:hypothetical protein B5X24_HaOG202666 [Helicoverpa armigera]|uniref:Uncharacterized protein n=2 Tax=Helicoverpa armigera TaxID=29058 RepID=A0A2W1BWJ5_HELAM|nr:hypothetical protein B5X24_HaOG202666 [Helicoverpa armigera]